MRRPPCNAAELIIYCVHCAADLAVLRREPEPGGLQHGLLRVVLPEQRLQPEHPHPLQLITHIWDSIEGMIDVATNEMCPEPQFSGIWTGEGVPMMPLLDFMN